MDDFYEDDEDPAEVWAAFRAGEKHQTRPPGGAAFIPRRDNPERSAALLARAQAWHEPPTTTGGSTTPPAA